MAFCMTFISGYFWGKKQTFESANQEIQKMVATHHLWQRLPQPVNMPEEETAPAAVAHHEQQTSDGAIPSQGVSAPTTTQERWMAQLVGFGTRSAATAYQKHLQQRGNIETRLVERVSAQRRKGVTKKVVWYQVVTHNYESETVINQLIENIQRIKPIHSIKKIKVHNGTIA